MIAATGADYLALGHWDRAAQVGCGAVPAYYSGSPEYVHTVNFVRLTAAQRQGRERTQRVVGAGGDVRRGRWIFL